MNDIYEFSFTIEEVTKDFAENLFDIIKNYVESHYGYFSGSYFNQTEEKENKEDE